MAPEVIGSQLLQQIHMVSAIASAKMQRVRRTYHLSIPSVACWVIVLDWDNF